jgi:hypothetical protein
MTTMSDSPVGEPQDLDAAPVPPETPDSAGEPDEDDDQPTGRSGREARFRKENRALKAEAIVYAARTDVRDRRDVERIAAETLASGSEIWRDGTDLAALLDGDGLPSEEAVRARAAELLAAHGYLSKPRPKSTPSASIVTGDGRPPAPKSSSFEAAFQPQTGR